MQVSVETTSGLERRLIVGVPAERIDSAVNSKLLEAAKTVKLPGFRPGKIPMKVMRQRFGQSVRMEVLGQVMNDSFYEAIQQQDLKPAGQPAIEPKNIEEGRDLEFVATFEVFPDVELKDYSSLKIVKHVAELTDTDLDKMIENLREQRASFEAVERAAQDGDQVNIDYAGTKDGVAFDGGSAEGSDLVLGSGSMIPGFEDGVAGMLVGGEKVLSLSFPADYHSDELKGAAVEFSIKLNAVKAKQQPELNDEFFKLFNVDEGGLEAFHNEVRKNMQRELDNAIESRVKQQIMDSVLGLHSDLQVPQALIAQEIDALRNQQLQQFGDLAKQINAKDIFPDEVFAESAERRVKLGLVLNELVNSESIEADADKVRAAIEKMAETYQDKDEVVNWYYSNPQQLRGIESLVVENQVVDKLLEKAQLSEETSSYEKVMSPPEEATTEDE
ncbi:MAG: trigger factor [Bermanella sp.]|jgi:trigger factor